MSYSLVFNSHIIIVPGGSPSCVPCLYCHHVEWRHTNAGLSCKECNCGRFVNKPIDNNDILKDLCSK